MQLRRLPYCDATPSPHKVRALMYCSVVYLQEEVVLEFIKIYCVFQVL